MSGSFHFIFINAFEVTKENLNHEIFF